MYDATDIPDEPVGEHDSDSLPTASEFAVSPSSSSRRRAREQRLRAARRRRTTGLAVLLGVGVLIAAGVWWYRAPAATRAQLPTPQRSTTATATAAIRPSEPEPQPTPYFATYKGLKFRLPVAVDALTEVGFHQASYGYALALKSLLPDADTEAAKEKKQGTGRDLNKQETGEDAVLTGSVLRMWRSRPGKPNTAVDVGAAPGTPIIAPLDGTVVLVKSYNLYNKPKYPDYQIHIQPDGHPELDLVLIHVTDPMVKAGDRVMAGATPLGKVRKFSDRMRLQLGHYTKGGGDHTHVQLNDVKDPTYKGLEGAIDPSGL
jgi:murein DD-endopeptidase MepM/ murein hydrolase activator NlpD